MYLIFEDDSLFMQEVISTNAKSKLMVLSSCKSAVGKPTVEAQMGPAYAFSLAGVPNVVATLWDVSDRESAQLFPLFYKELSSGKSSEEALTLAKRAFLKSAPGPALHPYYWASSVYYGNPLTYESSNVKMYLVIAACFVFLLAGLMIRKRRI